MNQQNGQRQKRKRTRRELESWLGDLEDKVEALTPRIDQLDDTITKIGGAQQVIWNNQKELSRSEELLDEQFAVSTRMAVKSMNLILEKIGAEERITAKDIERLFRDWAEFKKRPDRRNLMMEWFLGVELSAMPPLPATPAQGDQHAEGDHGNQDAQQGVAQDSGAGQADDVSVVPREDRAEDQS